MTPYPVTLRHILHKQEIEIINHNSNQSMNNYPKIGIRPTIDGRQGGVRESLEDKTMNLAKAVAELISTNLRYPDGTPVELSLIHI